MGPSKPIGCPPALARAMAWAMTVACAAAASAQPVYYVSPLGNDANSGLSITEPWRTAAKVNAAKFAPGTQILFERGGEWRERIVASSSGTVESPITYGAYGTGAKPKFWGSDILDNAAFQPVAGSGSTFSLNTTTPVNSVLINQQFMRSSQLLVASAEPAANIDYVRSNANTWYHDGQNLYVNTGGPNPANDGRKYTAAVREDVVLAIEKDNLVFRDLVVDETAKYQSGYAFRVQYSSNVRILDSEAYRAGKHHFGVISSTGFVGQNLYARDAMPDQGFGGASAFVTYSDASRSKDSSRWLNVTVEEPGGAYPAFVMHGEGVGEVLVKNLVGRAGAGVHAAVESPDTRLRIEGGWIENGAVNIYGDGQVIDGLRVTGKHGSIGLNGSNNVVQNAEIDGYSPFFYGARNGAIVDAGSNNLIRFNRIRLDPDRLAARGAIAVMNAASGSEFYGNSFLDPDAFMFFQENTGISSHDNIFTVDSRFTHLLSTGGILIQDLAAWQQLGFDLDARVGEGLEARFHEERLLPGDDPSRSIPEPGCLALLAAATGLALLRRR